jgi:hypothetical protein
MAFWVRALPIQADLGMGELRQDGLVGTVFVASRTLA